MSNQLSPLDAAFLELEEGDAAAHMHIGSALVFDPPRPDRRDQRRRRHRGPARRRARTGAWVDDPR